jgi:SSS family solute:Na+ symporter
VLKLPATYAIEMQLLGGIWIGQLFPSVVCGVFTRWFNPWALLVGWAAGMASGTWMAASLQLRSSVYPLHLFGSTYAMYAAIPALLLNLALSVLLTLLLKPVQSAQGSDATLAGDYA